MRVLLAGEDRFSDVAPLTDGRIEVIGYAQNIGEAVWKTNSLRPDVVLLGPKLISGARRLASSVTVVIVSPAPEQPPTAHADVEAHRGSQFDALTVVLALAGASPAAD